MASKGKPKAKICGDKKHDEKTCFRCRLYALVNEEFHPETDAHAKAILFTLSEMVGMLLCQMEPTDTMRFVNYVFEWRNLCHENMKEEFGLGETKH